MNKQKFVDYLRSPEILTDGQFLDLQKILVDYPYFSIAKSVAARAAKELDVSNKDALVASAAIYATDRKHLKKYINGELVFLSQIPSVSEADVVSIVDVAPEEIVEVSVDEKNISSTSIEPVPDKQETVEPPTTDSTLDFNTLIAPSGEEVDQILDELERDMIELRKSREHFVDIQNQIEEEEAVSAALRRAVEQTKSFLQKPEAKEPKIEVLKKDVQDKTTEEDDKVGEIEKETTVELESQLDNIVEEITEVKKDPVKDQQKSTKVKEITNMTEDSDDDDHADQEPDSIPEPSKPETVRIPNPNRAKIKRSDLEKMIGKGKLGEKTKPEKEKFTPKIVDEALDASDEKGVGEMPEEVIEVVKESKSKKKSPVSEEVTAKKTKKEKKSKKPDKEKEEAQAIAITSEVILENAEPPLSDLAAELKSNETPTQVEKPEKEKIELPPQTTEPEISEDSDEMPRRSSSKAFIDFGSSGSTSTSISKASASKRKRSGNVERPAQSRPSSDAVNESKDNKDDVKNESDSGPREIIDKFITENPTIQRKPISDNKSDLSEESTKWNPEIASEYLAQIYMDQGNKKRAISIYEALSLKFPEKQSYFAALIQDLKQ